MNFAEGNNAFALALLERLRSTPGNLLFSPFSVRAVLGMALLGARGETAAEMARVLGFASPEEAAGPAFNEILDRNSERDSKCEIEVANRLWGQEGAPVRREYLEQVQRGYRSDLLPVDFKSQALADAVADAINDWVESVTRRRITNLVGPGALSPLTRLVLVNAVYFKGLWTIQFQAELTRNEPFHLAGGGSVSAPLMHETGMVRHVKTNGYQAVDLEYRGCDVTMLVILPDRRDGLDDLERRLDSRLLDDCVSRLRHREVEIFLPRFRITWGVADLADPLKGLGMQLAFSDTQADFSGINGAAPLSAEALSASFVLHKAFVEVNEEGTEAAAAAAMALDVRSAAPWKAPPPPPVFRADHPFVFAIRDRVSGAILFLGRVTDPTRRD